MQKSKRFYDIFKWRIRASCFGACMQEQLEQHQQKFHRKPWQQ